MIKSRENLASKSTANSLSKAIIHFLLFRKDAAGLQESLASLLDAGPEPELFTSSPIPASCQVPEIIEDLCHVEEEPALDKNPVIGIERLKLYLLLWMTHPGGSSICCHREKQPDSGDWLLCNKTQEREGHSENRLYNTTGDTTAAQALLEEKVDSLQSWCRAIAALCSDYEVLRTGSWLPALAEDDAFGCFRVIPKENGDPGQHPIDNTALILVNRSLHRTATIAINVEKWAQQHLNHYLDHNFHRYLIDALDNYAEIPLDQGFLKLTLAPLEGRLFLKDRWATREASGRRAGVLLHPTSLPSNYGIGDLGVGAREFVDFLAAGGQKLWQVLPLNPPGYGNSPYQCLSAFAGNPLLIDIDQLSEQGLLRRHKTDALPTFSRERIDFQEISSYKESLFKEAFMVFQNMPCSEEFQAFCLEHRQWLDDYCLFRALKSYHDEAPWTEWEPGASTRRSYALAHYRRLLEEDVEYHKFLQYQFFRQWMALKKYANNKGIRIIGDLPIYVSHDSSDVWVHRELFYLDEKGNPLKVAGVPPDAFTQTGQLWGNPIYNWDAMEQTEFQWWKERLKHLSQMVDIIRIDHFRGFEAYWEVPAGEETAVNGRWVKGPGEKFFEAISQVTGSTEIIAEDLGFITPQVEKLRDRFGFPGMSILQFEIQDGRFNVPLYRKNTVAYTGTHDNETILGWFRNNGEQKHSLEDTVGNSTEGVCWHYIETAMNTDAETVIIPLQDILCLGNEARMNTPGTATRNWEWRFSSQQLSEEIQNRLLRVTKGCHR